MIRLGLCCKFLYEPIKFYSTTATSLLQMERNAALKKLSDLCLKNADSLLEAIDYCASHEIGCFRVNSQILPVKTHPETGYEISDLPEKKEILSRFETCGNLAKAKNVRLSFHPDQFVVLNSPREDVVVKSIEELEYQAEVAEWIGADCINIHGGGAYGDKLSALLRLIENINGLSGSVRKKLTLENDDKVYTPSDLLSVCQSQGIPLVYDVHHHRCLSDGDGIDVTTQRALATWDREPLFHISSPLQGWDGPKPNRHHDFIDPLDFPDCWKSLEMTVEVEAKAKEVAVLRLQKILKSRSGVQTRP